ncbi:hypothetical protein [Mycobacterium sp.]|uniref:hypothetical protein n=1 Tax=Mycobacterium sp. TaxID=1785 RepID=UPI003A854369
MASLLERLAAVLADVVSVDEEADDALTVRHDGTFASLRVVNIVEGLDVVALTQMLAWDLPLTKKVRELVAGQAQDLNFGSVMLQEQPAYAVGHGDTAGGRAKATRKTADVMLRYNFPGSGLTDDALRTLILLVLDSGARVRRELTA